MSLLDSLESRFGKYAIPGLLKYLAYLVALTFVLYKLNPYFLDMLVLDPARVMQGEVWRVVSYIFIPSIVAFLPFPDWLCAVFYVLFMVWMSHRLEEAMGPFRVNLYTLLTIAGITIPSFFLGGFSAQYMFMQALFFAVARYYPEEQITIYFILPVKIKWMAWFSAALLLFQFTVNDNGFRMAMIAAMAAYFIFFGKEIYQETKLRHEVAGRRRKFEEAKRASVDETMHKCTVCGRTEDSNPDLEFRVSRDGQEYCVEHLPSATPKV